MRRTTTGHRSGSLPMRAALTALAFTLAQLSPSQAGWREDMKTFRVGMIAKDGATQAVPGLSILQRAYSMALGMPVEIFVARDYAALIDAQATKRVDYAIYSTAAYATAQLLCSCVEPVAAPVSDDGTVAIVSVLITRDDRLESLSEIRTHRVAIASMDSLAGSMLPEFELAGRKVSLTGAEPYVVRAESATAAEAMLVDGSVDAIFGWAPEPGKAGLEGSDGTLDRLIAAGLDRRTLKAIWRSQPLRYGPHALRQGLDGEVRTILVRFLTGLKGFQPDVYDLLEADHGGGLVEVGLQDYAAAVDMIGRLGLTDPEK